MLKLRQKINRFVKKNFKYIIFTEIILLFIATSNSFHINKWIISALIIIVGILTQVFTILWVSLLHFLSSMPYIGPYLVKFFTWPVLIVLNFGTFLVTYIAMFLGKGKRLKDSKLSATIFIIGLLFGFILGKIF